MLDRRRFVVAGLQVTAFLPSVWRAGRATTGAQAERVLVVVQLTGGNDGLNTVVPHRQDGYYRSRPTLALKRANLHALDDDHGLHPALKDLSEVYARGRLSVIHGVGYPHASRSHFRSMEIWHTAEPERPRAGSGWLGRLADQIAARHPGSLPALHVGDDELPLALCGERYRAPTLRDEHGLELRGFPGLEVARARVLATSERAGAELEFLRAAAGEAYAAAERISSAAQRRSSAEYPDLDLARKLRLIARLVAGGLGARIFLVTLGGFDTHARQAALQAARLDELARSLASFERDLESAGLSERVATLVFSEFGRRVAENGSRGTDHGAAAPVFLLGGSWRGGMRGQAPDLERTVEGDVPFTTDFRSLYATLETEWMGLCASTRLPPLSLPG